jgi:hypothetical protein
MIEKFANLRNKLLEKSTLLKLKDDEARDDDRLNTTSFNRAIRSIIGRSAASFPDAFRLRLFEYYNLLAQKVYKIISDISERGPECFFDKNECLQPQFIDDIEKLLDLLVWGHDFLSAGLSKFDSLRKKDSFFEGPRLTDLYDEYGKSGAFPSPYKEIKMACMAILNAGPEADIDSIFFETETKQKTGTKKVSAKQTLVQALGYRDFNKLLDLLIGFGRNKIGYKELAFDNYVLHQMIGDIKREAYKIIAQTGSAPKTILEWNTTTAEINEEIIAYLRKKILCAVESKFQADRNTAHHNVNYIGMYYGSDIMDDVRILLDMLNDTLRSMGTVTKIIDLFV